MVVYDVFCDACQFENGPVATSPTPVQGIACPACGMTEVTYSRARWEPEPGAPYRLEDLQPMRDRLLVAPLAIASRSKGGIHLAEVSHERERPQHGIVLRIGPGLWTPAKDEHVPLQAHVGDVVFFGKYSGQQFEIGGRAVLNMSEAEVFSVLPVGTFQVVEHEHPKDHHLRGDYCDLCASPEEKAAGERLALERQQLVADGLQAAQRALEQEQARFIQSGEGPEAAS